jgi:hypothetical protein
LSADLLSFFFGFFLFDFFGVENSFGAEAEREAERRY